MEEQAKSYIGKGGDKIWYLPSKGKNYWHRLNEPAFEDKNGTKVWYKNNKLHRLDGPAVERSNETKQWWVKGKLHRLDGPAIENESGLKEWWIEGKRLPTKKVEEWLEENNVDLSISVGQMAFKLRFME